MPCQQDELYAAEACVDPGNYFTGVDAAREYVERLRDTWWWEKWIPNLHTVEVEEVRKGKHGRNAAGAAGFVGDGVGRMEIHRGLNLYEQLIIHELTHVVAGARKGSRSHDPWFARIYLELTYLIRGISAYQQLVTAYVRNGIDYDAEGLAPRS